MDKHEKMYVNDIATRSFRDIADQDYIAARLCYRSGLMLNFVWMAQQAIEKYLKAILLYNGTSTKKLGHHLDKALRKVKAIDRIDFTLSEESKEFLAYLDEQGVNRYLERPHYTRGLELPKLDRCVWELRLYCRVIDYDLHSGRNMLELELRGIRQLQSSRAQHKFAILGGFLEAVLRKRDDPRREPLIWQNLKYGLTQRKRIRIPNHANSINPTQTVHPKHFELLAKYVDFPKSIRDHFERARRRQPTPDQAE